MLEKKAVEGGWHHANIVCGLDISTVHAAQGREKSVVILGLTRMGPTLHRTFMVGPRLFNVATSRAKDMMFFVGHWPSIMMQPPSSTIQQYFSHVRQSHHDFVLNIGDSPYTVMDQRDLSLSYTPSMAIRGLIHAGRAHWIAVNITEINQEIKEALQNMCPRLTIGENLIPVFREFVADMLRYKILLSIVTRRWMDDYYITPGGMRACRWRIVVHKWMLIQKYGIQISTLTGMWVSV